MKNKLIPKGQWGWLSTVKDTVRDGLNTAGNAWHDFWNSEFTIMPVAVYGMIPLGVDVTKKLHSGMTKGLMAKLVGEVTAAPAVVASASTVGIPATVGGIVGGTATGYVGNKAGRKVAKAVGADEKAQEMAGDVGGFVGSIPGAKIGMKYEIKPITDKLYAGIPMFKLIPRIYGKLNLSELTNDEVSQAMQYIESRNLPNVTKDALLKRFQHALRTKLANLVKRGGESTVYTIPSDENHVYKFLNDYAQSMAGRNTIAKAKVMNQLPDDLGTPTEILGKIEPNYFGGYYILRLPKLLTLSSEEELELAIKPLLGKGYLYNKTFHMFGNDKFGVDDFRYRNVGLTSDGKILIFDPGTMYGIEYKQGGRLNHL